MSLKTVKKNIILLGDGAVGKTSLIRRFVIDDYSDDYIQTIGSKVTKKEILIGSGEEQREMIMMVWDIIGQKGYRHTQSLSFMGMNGALLVSDMTREDTLHSLLSYWIPMVLRIAGPIPMIFLANKADLKDDHMFGMEELKDVAESCESFGSSTYFFLTSAKTGLGVEDSFMQLAQLTKDFKTAPKIDMEWKVMDVNEVKSPIDVLDHIIADFADQFGSLEHASPFIKHQMKKAELELSHPKEVSVIKFIDNLAKIEEGYKDHATVMQNRIKRLKLFGYKK